MLFVYGAALSILCSKTFSSTSIQFLVSLLQLALLLTWTICSSFSIYPTSYLLCQPRIQNWYQCYNAGLLSCISLLFCTNGHSSSTSFCATAHSGNTSFAPMVIQAALLFVPMVNLATLLFPPMVIQAILLFMPMVILATLLFCVQHIMPIVVKDEIC